MCDRQACADAEGTPQQRLYFFKSEEQCATVVTELGGHHASATAGLDSKCRSSPVTITVTSEHSQKARGWQEKLFPKLHRPHWVGCICWALRAAHHHLHPAAAQLRGVRERDGTEASSCRDSLVGAAHFSQIHLSPTSALYPGRYLRPGSWGGRSGRCQSAVCALVPALAPLHSPSHSA